MENEYITADVVQLQNIATERQQKATLFKKLQKARLDFLNKHIKANGRNNFNNFDYIQLRDIVREAIPILLENNLSTHIKMHHNVSAMEVVDLETGYSVEFTSAFEFTNEGKNNNQRLQTLGASESYLRRYLYLQVLDIVESDPDESFGEEKKTPRRIPMQKKDKNTLDESRFERIKENILADAEKQNVTPLTVAGEYFTKSRITRDEFRAIKKQLGGQQ